MSQSQGDEPASTPGDRGEGAQPSKKRVRVGDCVKEGRTKAAVFVAAAGPRNDEARSAKDEGVCRGCGHVFGSDMDTPHHVETGLCVRCHHGAGAAVESTGGVVIGPVAAPGVVRADDILAKLEARRQAAVDEALRKLGEGKSITKVEERLVEAFVERLGSQGSAGGGDDGDDGGAGVRAAVEALQAWAVNGEEKYQVHSHNRWLEVGAEKFRLMLARAGLAKWVPKGGTLSEVEEAVLYVTEERVLDIAVPDLAGYKEGVREMRGSRILVRKGPRLVVPKAGEWLFIEQLIAGRLLLPEEEGRTMAERRVQFDRFNWWLARAVENLYGDTDERLDTHVMIIAGPPESAKSRLQHSLITPVLGGLYGDPSKYFFGESTFNEGWIGKGHLLIEDPNPSSKMYDRLKFGQCLKGFCVNAGVTLHPKGKSEVGVQTRHRISISVNSHPDSLKVVPPLSADFRDKVLLFQVWQRPLEVPTRTAAERLAFRQRVESELPAYVHYLLHECVVPESERNERFGFKAYWDPELRAVLWEDTPTSEFLNLVDTARWENASMGSRGLFQGEGSYEGARALEERFAHKGGVDREHALSLAQRAASERRRVWIGTAAEIHELLLASKMSNAAKKIVGNNNVGAMLGRLAAEMPERVAPYRTRHMRGWVILSDEVYEDEQEAARQAAIDAL